MMFLPIIILGFIAWAIVSLARRENITPEKGGKRSPLDIAKERYARGDITKEEFDQIREDVD